MSASPICIVLRPGVEAIREFKVQTNMYSADLGRNSGAVVDVISKSGTNQLHGSAFEFLRNSAMDARNFFNTKGTTFPPFRFNQFGFSLGGPVYPEVYNGRTRRSSSSTTKATAATRATPQHHAFPPWPCAVAISPAGMTHLRSAHDARL